MVTDRKSQGIQATNQAYARYDQVEKKQEYHLAEGPHGEGFDEDYRIRTCDVGRFLRGDEGDRATFARELGEALHEIGFAILEGHGIDTHLYDEAEERVVELFTKVPLEEKLRFRARRHGSVNQGYFPIKETSDIHPDLVEGWVFCRRAFGLDDAAAFDPALFWPRPEMEPFFRGLCSAQEALFLPVMQSLLLYLGADPHRYDRALTGTNFGLRLNYYPPLAAEDETAGGGRMLGHEDVDLFTFLPAPRVEGLQVLNRATMKWIRLVRTSRHDHPQHRRLRAADQQRLPPLHHPPSQHPLGPGSSQRRPRLLPDGRLPLGGRGARGAARTRHAEVRADQGPPLPHEDHEQVLRRRLRGNGMRSSVRRPGATAVGG